MPDAADLYFYIRVGRVVGRVEQLGGLSQVDEDVRLCRVAP